MKFLINNIVKLFFPKTCAACNVVIRPNETFLCHYCRTHLPYSNHFEINNNELYIKLSSNENLQHAAALFYFTKQNDVHNLIHKLKYKNQQHIGHEIGLWIGNILQKKDWSIDMVIPVPIHPKKKKERGYNQLTLFGQAIANKLDIPYQENGLLRVKYSQSQSKLKRKDRLKLKTSTFDINTSINLSSKHILLIDDVITTGSTINSCINALYKHNNIKVSVVAIAMTS